MLRGTGSACNHARRNDRGGALHVAQIGNLLFRRLAVGGVGSVGRPRIANPRHSRLPVCATIPLRSAEAKRVDVQRFAFSA